MTLNDADIIALYFQRDESAIARTEEKYGPACRGIARRILQDPRDADECVDDAWIHAWNVIPPERPRILGAFLASITRNLAFNRYAYNRAEKRDTVLTAVFEELTDALPAVNGDVDLTSEIVFREFLNGFLRSLSRPARMYFVLRYWYGMSIREIAQQEQVSEEIVDSSIFRTRKRLREEMEKEGINR